SRPFVNVSTKTVRWAAWVRAGASSMAMGLLSAAGDGDEQSDLLARAQRARALRVLARDHGQDGRQRGRDGGLGAGEAVEQLGHRGGFREVEAEHGCLRAPGQPGSESDAYLHCCARAYAAGSATSRTISTSSRTFSAPISPRYGLIPHSVCVSGIVAVTRPSAE